MNIAIDITPLKSGHALQHQVRGSGFYVTNLQHALIKYFPEHEYTFFTRGEKLSKNIDLVHIPYFEPFFITLPLIYLNKTVITVHDLTPFVLPKQFPPGIKGKLKWQRQKLSLKLAKAVITDSKSSKKDIHKFAAISDQKIDVIYLAAGEDFRLLEKGKWRDKIRSKYRLPESFVLYVGDATNNKNLARLAGAIKILKVPLVVVGKTLSETNFNKASPWMTDLKNFHHLTKGDPNVIKLGFVPTDDLVRIYNVATVFVMPSLYEGFGLPILEAMQCGTPVITSNLGSLPEVAGEAAVYVDAYSVDSIASGIAKLFSNNALQESYRKKGQEQSAKFYWKKTAEETIAVYKKVV